MWLGLQVSISSYLYIRIDTELVERVTLVLYIYKGITSIREHDFMWPFRYIILNSKLSDIYAIVSETLWVRLYWSPFKREITNWRSTIRSSTTKILNNNMLKHTVTSPNRDWYTFIKRKYSPPQYFHSSWVADTNGGTNWK